jgi:hypothetical protein
MLISMRARIFEPPPTELLKLSAAAFAGASNGARSEPW